MPRRRRNGSGSAQDGHSDRREIDPLTRISTLQPSRRTGTFITTPTTTMIPTPDLSHLTRDDYDQVYEPAGNHFYELSSLHLV